MALVLIKDIKIGNRFRKDLGNLDSLTNSIKKVGLLHPIVLSVSLVMICGYRRLEVAKRLGWSQIEAHLIDLSNLSASEAEADENNIRKDFTLAEKAEIDELFREEEEAAAKQRQREGKPSFNLNKGRSAEKIAKQLNISYSQLLKIRELKKATMENPTLFKPLWDRANRTNKVDKPYNELKQLVKLQDARKRALENINTNWSSNHNSNFEIKLGRMQERGLQIADNSIPLIITDPPYGKESLHLCNDLVTLAWRVLRPGGSLVTITPNTGESFEYYFDTIRKAGLRFHHYIPLIHGGDSARLPPKSPAPAILVRHKPILWFFKPGPNITRPTQYSDIENVVYSEPPSKELHIWEQSPIEGEHFIKPLTVEGDPVLDPFCGTGAFGEGALKLGRKFIGIEEDAYHHSNAVNRLRQLEAAFQPSNLSYEPRHLN